MVRATQNKSVVRCILIAGLSLFAAGCATKSRVVDYGYRHSHTIYPLPAYPINTTAIGIKAAAVPYAPGRDVYGDPRALPVAMPPKSDNGNHGGGQNGEQTSAKKGLNVLETGVWPVRLIIDYTGSGELLIDPEQIVAVAGDVRYPAFAPQAAVSRVINSEAFREAIKGSRIGPFLKSIFGGEALVGAVRGGVSSVASGSVTGATSGAAKEATGIVHDRSTGYEKALKQLITHEYNDQAIKRQTLYPGFMADGLVFLPGDKNITAVMIPLYDLVAKKPILLRMELK